MRKPLIALLVAGTAGALVPQASAATRTVRLGDDWFVRDGRPTTVTVSPNTVVKWRWTGRDQHNVAATGPVDFQSPLQRSGSYRKKLKKGGRYRIVCSIHQPDMRMTLRVE